MRQYSVGMWHPGESSECEKFEWSLHNKHNIDCGGGGKFIVRQQLTLLLELSGFFIAIWIYLDGKSFCQRYFVTYCLKNEESNLRGFPNTGMFDRPLKLQQPHVQDPWHSLSTSNHMFKIPDILWASEQGLTIFLNTKVVILIGRNFWEILEHVVPSHYVHEFDTNMMSSVTHLVALANKAIHKIMPKDLIDATTKSLPECVQAIINSKVDRSKYWQGTFTVFRLFHGSISFWAFW